MCFAFGKIIKLPGEGNGFFNLLISHFERGYENDLSLITFEV